MTTPRGAFVLDVDDPYVYDLVADELKYYQESWELIEPRRFGRESLLPPLASSSSSSSSSPSAPKSITLPHHADPSYPISITYDPNEEVYNNNIKDQHTIYYTEYERVDWDTIDYNPLHTSSIWYTNRKGLIRKAELVNTIESHLGRCHEICQVEGKSKSSVLELNNADCDEVLDDENWYYFSDIESDTDNEADDKGEGEEEEDDPENDEENQDETSGETDSDGESSSDDEEDQPSSLTKKFIPPIFKLHEDCCPLQSHVPQSIHFTLFSLRELDELIQSELPEILSLDNDTETNNFKNGHVWILKPSMTNQAKGIHMIASTTAFRRVFNNPEHTDAERDDILAIRDWVIQKYIHPPFLLNDRKFHMRVYVYAAGGLNIYIFDRFLALFSLKQYQTVDSHGTIDPSIHITNTCFQKRVFLPDDNNSIFDEEKCVMLFHEAIEQWAIQYLEIMDSYRIQQITLGQSCTLDGNETNLIKPQLPDETVHHYQVRQLRAMIRYAKGLFYSRTAHLVHHNDEDGEDEKEEEEEENEVEEDASHLTKSMEGLKQSFSPFLFFFKRMLRQFTHNHTSQSTLHPATAISNLFTSTTASDSTSDNLTEPQFNIKECAKQIAIQFYHHALAQIRTILQELFIACMATNNTNRLDYQPQLCLNRYKANNPDIQTQHTRNSFTTNNLYDLFGSAKIVDDRLDADELAAKNKRYFQSGCLVEDPQQPQQQQQYPDNNHNNNSLDALTAPIITTTPPMKSTSAAKAMNLKYKPIPNSSELYGFDFILDQRCKVYLLEANPGPDFGQTGLRLKSIVCEPLIRGVMSIMLQEKRRYVIRELLKQYNINCGESDDGVTTLKEASLLIQQLPEKEQCFVADLDRLITRSKPLAVQHSAAILDCKDSLVGANTRDGNRDNCSDKISRTTQSEANTSSPEDQPVFINHRQETIVQDYIGTDGETWLEVMPTAPHFLPILHLPL